MFSLGLPSDPSPIPSPVQGQNGKAPSTRSSMGPLPTHRLPQAQGFSTSVSPRHTLEAGPSGCPANEFPGSTTFQTPEGDGCCLDVISMEGLSVIEQWFKVLSEESTQPLLTAFLQRFTRVIRFFIIVLQQMVRADPMTVLLSLAVGGSTQSQMEAKLATRTFNTSTTNRQSLAFDTSSSFLSPDTANTVGNPSDTAATLAQQRAKLKTAGNAAHRISTPALASSGERGTWAGVLGQVAERDNSPTQEIYVEPRSFRPQSTDFSGLSAGSAFLSSLPDGGGLDRLSPVKMSSNNNNGQTVDFAAAKLNDLYGSSNVPRLDGPDKFRWPSKGHVGDSTSGSNNGVTNSGVYGDDGNDCDLIQGHHAPGIGRVQSSSSRGQRNGGGGTWSGAQSPALSNTLGRFGGSDDRSNAMAAARQQAALVGLGMGGGRFNLRLGSPGLAGIVTGSIWRNSRSRMAWIRLT
ncbi:hypothetical protein EDB85DRAFT_2223714 [Lactarius pseudohatsudake]|nr:hypothetical protein EDB85DRAFT_2223714 [Lactarius pseudohatsudake]